MGSGWMSATHLRQATFPKLRALIWTGLQGCLEVFIFKMNLEEFLRPEDRTGEEARLPFIHRPHRPPESLLS